MPYKQKKPCAVPGCPNLTNSRYCEKHQQLVDKDYDRYYRTKENYSRYHNSRWKEIRLAQLHCAHCGHKLVGSYCTKTRYGTTYHRPIYLCYNGGIKAKNCTGQTVYSAMKIEGAVMDVVHRYFDNITGTIDSVWQQQAQQRIRAQHCAGIKAAKTDIARLEKQQVGLHQEVLKIVTGESVFDQNLLNQLISENAKALEAAKAKLDECTLEQEHESEKAAFLAKEYENICSWAKEFDNAPLDTQKMILAHLIEKITVDREYNIRITFFLTREELFGESNPEKIEIREAERCEFAV